MELTISKRNFSRGLARTHAVADRKSSMPILSNILISTDGPSTVRSSATDLYLGVSAVRHREESARGRRVAHGGQQPRGGDQVGQGPVPDPRDAGRGLPAAP